jgi:pyruvate dehydrogenase E2 component (dihydrolipoamide acetyltransferase)
MDWEAQDEGFLAKIILGEGTKDIAVGTPVAVVVEEEENVYTPTPTPPPTLPSQSSMAAAKRIQICSNCC